MTRAPFLDPSLLDVLDARRAVADTRLLAASERVAGVAAQIDGLTVSPETPPDAVAALVAERNLNWRRARRRALLAALALAKAEQADAALYSARCNGQRDAVQAIVGAQRRAREVRAEARAEEHLRQLWTLRTPRPPDGQCR